MYQEDRAHKLQNTMYARIHLSTWDVPPWKEPMNPVHLPRDTQDTMGCPN